MGEIKHTIGPWKAVKKFKQDGGEVYSIQSDSASICQVDFPYAGIYHVANHHDVKKANAALIAAAPELIEALRRICDAYARSKPPGYPLSDAEKLAHAAIYKATGGQP